jgi:hypothetical protein
LAARDKYWLRTFDALASAPSSDRIARPGVQGSYM